MNNRLNLGIDVNHLTVMISGNIISAGAVRLQNGALEEELKQLQPCAKILRLQQELKIWKKLTNM